MANPVPMFNYLGFVLMGAETAWPVPTLTVKPPVIPPRGFRTVNSAKCLLALRTNTPHRVSVGRFNLILPDARSVHDVVDGE